MRKLLVLVLFAVVACSTLEDDLLELQPVFDEVNLEGIDLSVFVELWEKAKTVAKKAVKFLKDNGLYEPLVDLLKTKGKELALNLCVDKLASEETCTGIIDWLLSHL